MKYENLKILSELRDKGDITEAEFQQEKEKILNDEMSEKTFFTFDNPLFGLTEKNYLMLMHLSQLLILFIPLVGILVPFVLWYINKDINPNVNNQGKNILNFNISFLIYSAVLAITLIGIPLAVVVVIVYLVLVIKTSINIGNGKRHTSYPLTIQFIK